MQMYEIFMLVMFFFLITVKNHCFYNDDYKNLKQAYLVDIALTCLFLALHMSRIAYGSIGP